jgi:uncharacterized LabA/DUF88 family protein
VDGSNFHIGVRATGADPRINIPHMARRLAKSAIPSGGLLVKLHYCTAPMPSPHAAQAEAQRRFFDQLRESSAVELVLGRHERRSRSASGTREYEEKETDVNVAIRLVSGAYEDRYDWAMVISGDSDLVPAMRQVRAMGRKVVWGRFEHQTNTDLAQVSDLEFVIDEKFLRTCRA